MRYLRLVVVAALLIFPLSAFASCPDRYDLFSTSFFFFDTTCGNRTGSISTSSLSCGTQGGADQFGVYSGSVVYTMTVPSDLSGSPWAVFLYVDFNDPSTYSMNAISASVSVTHNGNVTHSETIFIHAGNNGSLSCQGYNSSTFSASPGDTITVTYTGVNYTSGTTMKIAAPYISFN